MGLDVSHDAWHGAYSAFMRWREKLAEVAGLPPLCLMEGFWCPDRNPWGLLVATAKREMTNSSYLWTAIGYMEEALPIRWDCLKPDPILELLSHSDCDGEIAADRCGPIADSLERLIPLLPNEATPGHIGHWRDKTQQFVKGLRAAAAAGEDLLFR